MNAILKNIRTGFLPRPQYDRSHQEVLAPLEAPGGDKVDFFFFFFYIISIYASHQHCTVPPLYPLCHSQK